MYVSKKQVDYGENLFLMSVGFFTMEEVFLSLEEEDSLNSGPDITSASSPPSSKEEEYVIHGSPIWLIVGLALFSIMILSLVSGGSGERDWSWWFTIVALTTPLFGFFEYMKTVIVSWDQEQRHVEVYQGARASDERWLMFAYTSKPGDEITIESDAIIKGADWYDIFSNREFWLVVKRKDGTLVASSKDAENTHHFAKRIKECLDHLQ